MHRMKKSYGSSDDSDDDGRPRLLKSYRTQQQQPSSTKADPSPSTSQPQQHSSAQGEMPQFSDALTKAMEQIQQQLKMAVDAHLQSSFPTSGASGGEVVEPKREGSDGGDVAVAVTAAQPLSEQDQELIAMTEEEFEAYLVEMQQQHDQEFEELEQLLEQRREMLDTKDRAWRRHWDTLRGTPSGSSSETDVDALKLDVGMIEEELKRVLEEQQDLRSRIKDHAKTITRVQGRHKYDEDHLVEQINAMRWKLQESIGGRGGFDMEEMMNNE